MGNRAPAARSPNPLTSVFVAALTFAGGSRATLRRIRPKVVSERLGHASIGITLDTYSHVMPGMQEEAAEKIDAGLRAALPG